MGADVARADDDSPRAANVPGFRVRPFVATLYRSTAALAKRARDAGASMRARADTIAELQTRIGALHQLLEPQVGPPTADMRAQLGSFSRLYARLERAMSRR